MQFWVRISILVAALTIIFAGAIMLIRLSGN